MTGPYFIVGTKHRGPDAEKLLAELPDGEPLLLVREPTNKFDPNAVKVVARGVCVGYVRGSQSGVLAPTIDRTGLAMDAAAPAEKQILARFARTANSKIPTATVEPTAPTTKPEEGREA